jgi:serine/threonine protein kinase
MSDLLEGVMLSEYLLLQCISRGGIADVYRARQTGEGNYEVAVKVFRPGYAQRESFREYFMAEAEKIGLFEHQNILPFLEFGEGADLLYSVTPLVTTGTLGDLLRRVGGKFSAMQALPIMQQLCSAVQYAHDHNVIHGNIKPTNIFVAADGRMLLADFGIIRGYDDSQQSLTRIGWGSAEYAAPEQSLGVLRRASDIYSLGVLLFRILTGQPPFTGHTPVEVLLKHVRQPAPSARSLDANISDAVEGVLHMALQKRSDDRFTSAEEFSNALAAAVSVAPVASPVAKAVAKDSEDSEMTLPRKTNYLQGHEESGVHTFWSSEPVEWSPIGSETTGSMPSTAAEYLHGKSMPLETAPEKPSPLASEILRFAQDDIEVVQEDIQDQPASGEARNGDKDPDSRLKKLLPILVVILLLIGLVAALLSSFLFPDPSSGTNMGAEQLVVRVSSTANDTVVLVTSVSIGRTSAGAR